MDKQFKSSFFFAIFGCQQQQSILRQQNAFCCEMTPSFSIALLH
jgi:hypothetical protein